MTAIMALFVDLREIDTAAVLVGLPSLCTRIGTYANRVETDLSG